MHTSSTNWNLFVGHSWPRRALILLCFALVVELHGQEVPLTSPTDSIAPAKVITSDTLQGIEDLREGPRKALLWSILPGGGQVKNKQWWKVPIVYGGLLGVIAYADFNQTRFRRFVTALENRCLGEGNVIIVPFERCISTPDEFSEAGFSDQALITARDAADRARQTAYIGIFVVYLLQAVEAYTNAHLQAFDISDDLSLQVGPVLQPDGRLAAGLTVPLGQRRSLLRQQRQLRQLTGQAR